MLNKAHIPPPYILVGHSKGGLNMQLVAQMHPNEIAGVVLIDSVSRNQNFHDPAPPKTSQSYREAVLFDESRTQVKDSTPFPAIPLIVLTATNHHEPKQREQTWQK
jgi:pimeloyl-ACP methyl ester carboxylesterase